MWQRAARVARHLHQREASESAAAPLKDIRVLHSEGIDAPHHLLPRPAAELEQVNDIQRRKTCAQQRLQISYRRLAHVIG
jgi:predicted amino acid racemase